MAKQKARITASRSFVEGLARIFDSFSNFDRRRHRSSYGKTVTEQFREDWETIGRDMKTALTKLEKQEKETFGR